ncbi:Tyrosine kinase receptor Cad96Ca [Acropora cervicornis]|uniref:receptor protein-tyrosine kinase n=1 Tax=Acropora cervicornis TaxID=6130 RepID=A0AAD9R170_ACRCE|nr:Tyrosine kinase receptor Cad96Ca [Acropora cervicornis]
MAAYICQVKRGGVEALENKQHVSDEGSTETVRCSEQVGDTGQVAWYHVRTDKIIKTGERFELTGLSMKITNVQPEHAGTYECRGGSNRQYLTIYVNVEKKEIFLLQEPKVEGCSAKAKFVRTTQEAFIYGGPGIIHCSAVGNPAPQFNWTRKDGRKLQGRRFSPLANGSLMVKSIKKGDKGIYICTIHQSRGSESTSEKSKEIVVTVIVPPKVNLSELHHPVTEGENVTLTCNITDGDPKPNQVRWLKDKNPLDEKKTKLVLRDIRKEQEGTYTCEAENGGGSANDSIKVIVDTPPKLNPDLKDGSVSMHLYSLSRITCTESGDPEPNVTWTKNGTYIVKNNTLTIDNVTLKDAGQYGCTAENRAGKINATVGIDVIESPVVVINPRNQTVFEGRTAEINCTAKGIPRPELSWTFDNGKPPPADAMIRNSSNQSILQLSNTSKNMEGWYTCRAKNKAGEASLNSTLHVLEKPTVTMSPKVHPSLVEGERLTLTCRANEATKEIRWTKDDLPVNSRANIYPIGNNSTLVIENVLTSDSGRYACEARNDAGSASSSVDVRVTAAPAAPAVQWYVIAGPVLAVTVLASIALHLWKRRIAGLEDECEMEKLEDDEDKWEIPRKRITLEEVIGSGSFGTVWRAVLSNGNGQPGIQFVAAKCFSPISGEEGRKSIMKEIGLGKELGDSPQENIVQFIGCVTKQIHPILLLEYLPFGDLLGFLRKSRGIVDKYYRGEGEVAKLKTYDLVSFSNQIATGMVFLASRGIIHRDLAARNVLLDKNRVCKVADFGLYYHNFKYGHGNAKKGCVPVKWTAPEILFGDAASLSSKSDVWSYGIVLYEIFTMGGIPYPGWSEGRTITELQKGYRMPRPPHIQSTLYHLMSSCWQEDPILRPEFLQIRNKLIEFIENELYLGLMDQSKYDGSKYANVEDLVETVERPIKKKWSSLKQL